MKKLVLSAALLFAFATAATAQDTTTKQTETTTIITPATATPAPAATATTGAIAATADEGKEFTQVKQAQIAPAVLKEAVAKYKDYSLVEALAATDGTEYKLVLTKDGKDIAAYYTSAGKFIKEEAA